MAKCIECGEHKSKVIRLDNGEAICKACWKKAPNIKDTPKVQRKGSQSNQTFSYWSCFDCKCGSASTKRKLRHTEHNIVEGFTRGKPIKSWGKL